jgi:prepilin-type N-terminal cleavage/methylation domain-containing protein
VKNQKSAVAQNAEWRTFFAVVTHCHVQNHSPHSTRKDAFSLVEVLICLGIIGVLCAIAINAYSGKQREVIERITNQRNAQEIVSLGVCASMGGCRFIEPGNRLVSIEKLIGGTVGTTGIWRGQVFRLASMHPENVQSALPYVKLDGEVLLYDPSGSQPAS